jgi:alpha-ketoglutarate-dependent taurine dioxygenase
MGFVYTGAAEDGLLSLSNGVAVVESTADWVEGTPAAQGEIRQLLRNQGVKVSMKHVSKDAALLGKWAGRFGKVLAAKSAYDRYQECRGN